MRAESAGEPRGLLGRGDEPDADHARDVDPYIAKVQRIGQACGHSSTGQPSNQRQSASVVGRTDLFGSMEPTRKHCGRAE